MARARGSKAVVLVVAVLLLASCTAIGPRTVARDRFDYIKALSESWKRQMLLNLVKLRYMDALVFLEVSSVVAQYVLETELEGGLSWDVLDPAGQTLGGRTMYTDRPTITYSPLTGDKLTRSLLRPIPLHALLSLLEAGYPVDFIFRICVQTINGIDNRFGGGMAPRPADPAFYQFLEAMKQLQRARTIGFRVKPGDEERVLLMVFRDEKKDEMVNEATKIRQILGLDPDVNKFRIVYGAVAADDREIAILTRSMLTVMSEIASYIEVPSKEAAEGGVFVFTEETSSGLPPLIRIMSSESRPENSIAAVKYRSRWFWIDNRDLDSKRVFAFLLLLMSFTDIGVPSGAPVLTIPTG
jgi:hypothetical protein